MKGKKIKPRQPSCCQTEELRIHGLVQAMLLLNLGEEPRHGYELCKVLSLELPEALVPAKAVLYRILRDLEKDGCIRSRLTSGEGGPARKVYSLTPEGDTFLAHRYEMIQQRVEGLNHFLERYKHRAGQLHIEEDTE